MRILLALIFATLCTAPVLARSYAEGPHCGVERWSIKTMMDPAARQITPQARPVTIAQILRQPAPADPDAIPDRLAPFETTLWVVEARLLKYKLESDLDYHLVLVDPQTGQRMIAEIPSPDCSSVHQDLYRNARATVDQIGNHAASRRWWYLDYRGATPPMVRIWGIGFFDFEHNQSGSAPNDAEIHPVLKIELE